MGSVPAWKKKKFGQYMTPACLREPILDRCDLFPDVRVLDPGAGTGEFLRSVMERQPSAELHGWDIDPELLRTAAKNAPTASLSRKSALDIYIGEPFDLVVGNPPYFQFTASPAVKARFSDVISGRVNIFALFFQAAMEVLRPGGQIAYVVPPSMNTGAYFASLRSYLLERADIEFLEIRREQNLFFGARTPVQLIVLRKHATRNPAPADRGKHVFIRDTEDFRCEIFTENPSSLDTAFASGDTLFELGYEAATGTIPWNQHRGELRSEQSSRSVPLIWAHDIGEGELLANRNGKPGFIDTPKPPVSGPAVVANRIIGAIGGSRMRCALIPEGIKFLAENHVNVIREHTQFPPLVCWEELLGRLRSPSTRSNLNLIASNTQISATELTHLLPI